MPSDYYDLNKAKFVSDTIKLNMNSLYAPFLSKLTKESLILDAGCGSGRDAKNFLELGYEVEAFDISPAMVEEATKNSGILVSMASFQTMDWKNKFNGIWACASLLHVPREKMNLVFNNLSIALKSKGILYCSFKNRENDFIKDGRIFTCYTDSSFKAFIEENNLFNILEIYITKDLRENRKDELWLNVILQKNS